MIRAIVYTSNTGSTAAYAKLLGEQINLPVFPLNRAKERVPAGSEIIYLGWIMARGVKGYRPAAKRYRIPAVCAVGMDGTGTQLHEVRQKNNIPADVRLFTLQGGFDRHKLHGVYRLMMDMMAKSTGKALSEKPDRTSEEDDMLDMMLHGGSRVSGENLNGVLKWYRTESEQ
ncbi:hypothetical protein SAMN05216343_12311 [Oscillibacter sp. PC13]|uniref:hypothetical protein n=1 Tax=Oscillibacter sp. PC13 TaxID=1855299 RepID=UPI0008F36637|nr:hypothetical protein [Oscillibacter sp. PC13]SFQ08308.1 hypothetical protein SAMN05216343_12311 [Oscillibacter sp. PC13]